MTISKATSRILDQLINVINKIDAEDYVKPLAIYNGATIGKHFRHIYDFYDCLICGGRKGCIDYCNRNRIVELESSQDGIITFFNKIKSEIDTLDPKETIEVYGDFEYENGDRPKCTSSLGREMLYAYDHAVHHLAIIKLGIRAEIPGVLLDNSIGIAASTLRHQFINTK
ncbi:MAG: hypothetical protein V3V00_06880 [Saprospiraceae bacterium]